MRKVKEQIRLLQELADLPIEQWTEAELREYHYVFNDVSPWLNAQGVSLHRQVVDELIGRDRTSTFKT